MLWQINIYGSGGLDPTQLTPMQVLELLLNFARIALSLIGIIVVIYIIVAGIQYITAAGDPGKQGEARKAIQYSLIGLAITIVAFMAIRGLLQILNFDDTILNNSPFPEALRNLFQR